MASMKTHHLILYYGNTLSKDSPLILIVGREPNNTVPFDNKVGTYDLAKKNGGWYWKRIHYYLENASDKKYFREACIYKGDSPLIFTYISPIPLKHHKKSKNK